MASNSISKTEWKAIHKFAVKIANASTRNNSKLVQFYEKQLHTQLKKLLRKYGPLPTIISTQADYTSDSRQQLSLYKQAYAASIKTNDKLNGMLAAWSIASIYVLDLGDRKNGLRWVRQLRKELVKSPDKYILKECRQLEKNLRDVEK